jgi:hypothetical protein
MMIKVRSRAATAPTAPQRFRLLRAPVVPSRDVEPRYAVRPGSKPKGLTQGFPLDPSPVGGNADGDHAVGYRMGWRSHCVPSVLAPTAVASGCCFVLPSADLRRDARPLGLDIPGLNRRASKGSCKLWGEDTTSFVLATEKERVILLLRAHSRSPP